ncbi:Crp/Fnr family transcriptional regulator [Desulfococcus sp.]|uniref:Crp/Fnr family transcriptional regulator n=1 Tax=Desulfococcus sp. TaxID=2025834 RepID=UPI0035946DC0
MAVDVKLLETIDLFEGLGNQDLDALAALLKPMRVKEGEVLMRMGDSAQNFYVILSGSFMIFFKDGKAFTLHEKGDVIGMSTMLEPFNYRGTTVALTDGEVLIVSGDPFNELIRGSARAGEVIMRRLNDVITQRMFFFAEPVRPSEDEAESDGR